MREIRTLRSTWRGLETGPQGYRASPRPYRDNAAAMVYAAMRVAQGEVAGQCEIEPEEISPAKFFPKMAAACHDFTIAVYTVEEIIRMNPGKNLRRPRWKGRRFTTINLDDILVRERNGERRRRRFCKARRQWKSITHVRGGRELS